MSPLKGIMRFIKCCIVVVLWLGIVSCGSYATAGPPNPSPSSEVSKPILLANLSTQTPGPTVDPVPVVVERVLSTIAAMQTSTPKSRYAVKPTPSPTPTITPEPTQTPTPTVPPTPTPTLSTIISRITPAVVSIQTQKHETHSTSSGVIYKVDRSVGAAIIITSELDLRDSTEIIVTIDNSTKYIAQLLGVDRQKDLAVLKVCCNHEFISISMGDALTLQVGSDVISVGSSDEFGSGIRVSRGIVSAIRFQPDEERWIIQTDLSVPKDGSGSPVLSQEGKLLGISTSALSGIGTLSKEGYNFAVSEVTISDVLSSLEAGS